MAELWKPTGYRTAAVAHVVARADTGLFLDPGMGKTSIILAAFVQLRKTERVGRLLVLAPLRPAYSVWPNEVAKWSNFAHLKISVLHGPKKDARLDDEADIHVLNFDGLDWFLKQMLGRKRFPYDWLVIDESTKIKNTQTKRFKALRPMLPHFKRRTILTGTPAPNGLLNLFGQVYAMDLGRSFGPYVTHYRRRFFDQTGYMGYDWKPKVNAERDIYACLQHSVMRLSSEDHQHLPPLIFNDIKIELPAAARRSYAAMEMDLIAQVDGEVVTAKTAGAATISCRQIANGGIYLDRERKAWKKVHDAKTEALLDVVEELDGKPLLIAYEFHHDLARLQEALPDLPHVGGGVTAKRGVELEAAWNAGALPYLAVHPQAAAHGLNLQAAPLSALFLYSLTWDLELYQQLIKRLHREGRQSRVVVHRAIATDTVDEVIVRTLRGKQKTQDALFSALRSYALSKKVAKRR